MAKSKSYTKVWNVEKVLYGINDVKLPFPVTFNQMAWFTVTLVLIIMFDWLPPLSMINSVLLKYIALPVGIAWFMSRKTFDGKKPFNFLGGVISYLLRPKVTYSGKSCRLKRDRLNIAITSVRSEVVKFEE